MLQKSGYAKAKNYVERHLQLTDKEITELKRKYPGPCITISRQSGIETHELCQCLIKIFRQYYGYDWAYFDKDLLRKVIDDHHLPERVEKFLNEERRPVLNQMLNELLGIHPPLMELIHRMSRTILKLGEIGNVILIGRGSNIVTSHLKNAFHIRLVSPLSCRIANLQRKKNISKDWAKKFLLTEDNNRRDFLYRIFRKDIDDPTIYHTVINASLFSDEELAETIYSMVKVKIPVGRKQNLNIKLQNESVAI